MMKLHAEFVVDRALDRVDASEDQRAQIDQAVERLFSWHEGVEANGKALHAELTEALTAETIDPQRLETLRAKHLQLIDQGSRELTRTITEIASALTPEQRQELADWVHELHGE